VDHKIPGGRVSIGTFRTQTSSFLGWPCGFDSSSESWARARPRAAARPMQVAMPLINGRCSGRTINATGPRAGRRARTASPAGGGQVGDDVGRDNARCRRRSRWTAHVRRQQGHGSSDVRACDATSYICGGGAWAGAGVTACWGGYGVSVEYANASGPGCGPIQRMSTASGWDWRQMTHQVVSSVISTRTIHALGR
jgi:hypothetical protein